MEATNLGGLWAGGLLIFNLVSSRDRSLGAGEEQATISAKSLQVSVHNKGGMHAINLSNQAAYNQHYYSSSKTMLSQ